MKSITKSILIALSLAAGGAALAHETWLAADQRTIKPGAPLKLDMSSGEGETFPGLGAGIAVERIETSGCLQGDAAFAVRPVRRDAKALRLVAQPPGRQGVTCWVQLHPRPLVLAANKIKEYFDEIDASAALRKSWDDIPAPKTWNEVYSKSAKVIVPSESAAGVVQAPVGLRLEFVPQVDLSSGRIEGNKLPLTVLLDGGPVAGLGVALMGRQLSKPVRLRTDGQGRVEFTVPKAGRWLLAATDLRLVDAAYGMWESQFATLVFEIVPESR